VHRLDVRTGGLVAVARTAGAMVALSEAFAARQVHKRYVAVVTGRFEGERVVDAPVEGREARTRLVPTRYSPSLTCGTLTTVDCFPETGRTHQIRRHLAGLGHPILGDDLYGGEKVLRGAGLFLWAVELDVPRPGGGIARATWGPPPKLEAFLSREARRFSAYTA
jgi:23S rRNA-/tRNA-specific pseudouridylate synthase